MNDDPTRDRELDLRLRKLLTPSAQAVERVRDGALAAPPARRPRAVLVPALAVAVLCLAAGMATFLMWPHKSPSVCSIRSSGPLLVARSQASGVWIVGPSAAPPSRGKVLVIAKGVRP